MIVKLTLFTFLVICLITISATKSYAFRCGNDIVSRWDSANETKNKCGKPYSKNYGHQNINGQTLYVEKWYYNCGENDFIYSISIYDDKIVAINPIKRGYGKGQCK